MNIEEENTLEDLVRSWIVYTCKNAMGNEKVRESVIREKVQELGDRVISTSPDIIDSQGTVFIIGKLFEPKSEEEESDIPAILEALSEPNTIYLFSASNIPDPKTDETHFQSYIVDNIHGKIYIADPAGKPPQVLKKRKEHPEETYSLQENIGIYGPWVTENTVLPYYIQKNYKPVGIFSKTPLQQTDDDVFCQTWSLIMQIEKLKLILTGNANQRIDIPSGRREKYGYLLDFFKSLSGNEDFCRQLNLDYRKNVVDRWYGSKDPRTTYFKQVRDFMKDKNVCDYVGSLTIGDLQIDNI